MLRLTSTFPLLILLLWGCTAPPKVELAAARAAMAEARAAGAQTKAPDDFIAAEAALQNAEKLFDQGHFSAAREILPFATAQARRATEYARSERAKTPVEVQLPATLQVPQTTSPPPQPVTQAQPAPPATVPAPTAQKKLPAPAKPVAPASEYRVKPGETLWTIAAREAVYGDPWLWPLLYKANRDQIKDPKVIYDGQILSVPRGMNEEDLQAAREEARASELFGPGESGPGAAKP